MHTMNNVINEKRDLTPNKKIGVMDIFMISLIRVKELAETSVKSASKFVNYVVFISLFVALIVFGVPTASKIFSFGGFYKLFTSTMPQFEMGEDKKLVSDKRFEMNISNVTIIMDTSIDTFVFGDFEEEGLYIAIGAGKTKMIQLYDVNDDSSYNEIYNYPNEVLFNKGFNNQTLVSMIPLFYVMLFVSFCIVATYFAAKYLVLAVIFAIVSRSLTNISKLPMTFRDSFRMCFYSQTISIILVNVNASVGYFVGPLIMSIIGIIITTVIIHMAMGPHMPDIDDILDKFHDDDNSNNSSDKK